MDSLFLYPVHFPLLLSTHRKSLPNCLPNACSFFKFIWFPVYGNYPPSMLLTDPSIPELLYQLTTPNYSALNNVLLILPCNCLRCGLTFCSKLLLPWEKNHILQGMSKWDQCTWDTQGYHFCCFRLRTTWVAPPIPRPLIVSSTELGTETMPNKYMLNETENSLLCLGHDARVGNIQMIFNQEFSSKNSMCLPSELDVLGQTSTIEKNS